MKVWRLRSNGLVADHRDADVGHKVWRAMLSTMRPQVRGGRRRGATSRKSTHDTTVRDATKNSGFKVTADGARQENEKH